eukprot:m.127882 g.127882  ORF g.127882 m.127882 type:complete len:375 (+) comp14721_c0_seq4:867-1991(+)
MAEPSDSEQPRIKQDKRKHKHTAEDLRAFEHLLEEKYERLLQRQEELIVQQQRELDKVRRSEKKKDKELDPSEAELHRLLPTQVKQFTEIIGKVVADTLRIPRFEILLAARPSPPRWHECEPMVMRAVRSALQEYYRLTDLNIFRLTGAIRKRAQSRVEALQRQHQRAVERWRERLASGQHNSVSEPRADGGDCEPASSDPDHPPHSSRKRGSTLTLPSTQVQGSVRKPHHSHASTPRSLPPSSSRDGPARAECTPLLSPRFQSHRPHNDKPSIPDQFSLHQDQGNGAEDDDAVEMCLVAENDDDVERRLPVSVDEEHDDDDQDEEYLPKIAWEPAKSSRKNIVRESDCETEPLSKDSYDEDAYNYKAMFRGKK